MRARIFFAAMGITLGASTAVVADSAFAFAFGASTFDLDELETQLGDNGYAPRLDVGDVLSGFSCYRLTEGGLVLGVEIQGARQSVFSDSARAEVSVSTFVLQLGRTVHRTKRLRVYPLIGIGNSGARVHLTRRAARPGFDGTVPIDAEAAQRARRFDFVETIDAAHVEEHAIEVQLPFLQRRLPHGFHPVPFVVGQATPDQVEAVMEELWGGVETLIVVSSDLSHFHDYDTARRIDADTSAAIENLSPQSLQEGGACGRVPIQALLSVAVRRGLTARTVDLRNSGDTAGGRSEVVGYGAYVIG